MYVKNIITRCIHLGLPLASEKSALATLRKKTGYTFSNCKKALQLHENNLQKAEKWLHEQAQSLGWSKATKLEGRQTSQGLIGVTVDKNYAALVEVNCETDFVAKNDSFKEMVETATKACLLFAEQQTTQNEITKIGLDTEQLKSLKTDNGKLLSDHLALMIGQLGENATLRRAICFKTENGVSLSCYAHPSGAERNNILLGKFGGLVALKQLEQKDIDIDDVGRKICQHVVGMNPQKIGGPADEPIEVVEDEPCLIHQEYLHDDSLTVKEILEENGIEVLDFKRFGCGENMHNGKNVQTIDNIETCQ